MKKLLLSTVALVGLATSAMAADLPARRTVAPAPFVAVPVFTWTGFYAGVNAGYGFSNSSTDSVFLAPGSVANSLDTTGTLTFGDAGEEDGFVGGAQIGYNLQFGAFVVGVEADLQYADLGNGDNNGLNYNFVGVPGVAFGAPLPRVSSGVSQLDYFGTVRARAGVAFDRVLVYATGGFAFGGGDSGSNGFINDNDDDIRGGYVVGGGIEYAFTNNLTAKIEGLYVNLDRNKNRAAFFDAATNTVVLGTEEENDFGVVRVGVNFKF